MAESRLSFDILAKDRASPTFLKVAASSRLLNAALDDVSTNARGLAGLTLAPSLVPALAVATSSAVSLGTALGAAAGAGGIFGASVIGQVTEMKKQQTAIGQVQTKLDGMDKSSKDYASTLESLHEKQSAFNQQFGPAAKGFSNLKLAWESFLGSTGAVTNSVLGKAMNLLASILPKLVPVANAAGRAVGGLIDELAAWSQSPAFDKLLNFFATSGAQNITRFGHMVGNVFSGLGGILSNFVDPGDHAAASLESLTQKFAAWGNSKGVSESVQNFLNYAHDNGPQVASILGSLVTILPKLLNSFSGLGSLTLTGVSGFLRLVAHLPAPVFNALATAIFTMAAAIKVVRIATAAWAVVQGALNVVMDANPIGLIILAIAALAAGLVYAYKHSETFRDIVNGALHAVGAAATWLWNNAFQPAFKGIVLGASWVLNALGSILIGIGKLPKMGWATDAGRALQGAADSAQHLADNINKIPAKKKVTITVEQKMHYTNNSGIGGADKDAYRVVPHLASGGIVTARPGGTLALLGEAGRDEMVTPLPRAGGAATGVGETHIQINVYGVLDGADGARKIREALLKHKRTNGGMALGLS